MKNIGLIAKASAAALVLAAGLMTGCGSSGGGSSGKTGTFEDAAVAGISYSTSSGKSGTTDADGKFEYKEGDTITFSIGSIVFPGGIPQDGIITPAHLAGVVDWENDDTAVNIIQFLMSVDEDGDETNGIQIPAGLAALVNANPDDYGNVGFSDGDFDAGLASLIADMNSQLTELTVTLEVVTADAAKAHFALTIEGLGIDIEIQISTEVVACTAGNTAAIEGTYDVDLTGTINISLIANVDGSSLTIDTDPAITTCTFVQSQVSVPAIGDIPASSIITDTWLWTKTEGATTQTYTINRTSGVLSFIAVDGADSGTDLSI